MADYQINGHEILIWVDYCMSEERRVRKKSDTPLNTV